MLGFPWALSAFLLVYFIARKAAFIAVVNTPLCELCPDLGEKASHMLQALVLLDTDRHGLFAFAVGNI